MADKSDNDSSPLLLRLYANADGKVFMLYEPKNWQVEVEAPVTEKTLDEARIKLARMGQEELNKFTAPEGQSDETATPQQLANRQIKRVIKPPPESYLRFIGRLFGSVFRGLYTLLVALLAISFIYKGVQFSRDNLPEALHLVVLFLYLLGLTLCIYLIATEEKRRKEVERIRYWFGHRGLLFLPALTLIVAASVFASLTYSMHNHQWVTMQPCAGREVSEGSLLDFYVWHFFKLVPLLKLNETLKWGEPLCYTQARVGFLILFFQAVVVLPSINTIRFYWRNRKSLDAKPYDYLYEPEWKPAMNKP